MSCGPALQCFPFSSQSASGFTLMRDGVAWRVGVEHTSNPKARMLHGHGRREEVQPRFVRFCAHLSYQMRNRLRIMCLRLHLCAGLRLQGCRFIVSMHD